MCLWLFLFSLSSPIACASVLRPLGVAVNQRFLGSHWDHSWNQRGLLVTMGKSQAAIQTLLHHTATLLLCLFVCLFNFNSKIDLRHFYTINTFRPWWHWQTKMNCKHCAFWSCGLQCMLLVYCMCYATSMSAELNYQQFSRLDRVVCVDTEFLRR